MSAPCSFARSKEAREEGWFSRRHQTLDSHHAAMAAHEAKIAAERVSAKANAYSPFRSLRPTPLQQLSILDSRLGKGQGAKKERARLAAKLGLTPKS